MLTKRDWNVAKIVATQLRYDAGLKATPPGPAAYRPGPDRVTTEELRELRAYVRAALEGDLPAMRRFGA